MAAMAEGMTTVQVTAHQKERIKEIGELLRVKDAPATPAWQVVEVLLKAWQRQEEKRP